MKRTLVEGLVILTITGGLAILIVPGVQNARDAAGAPRIPTSSPDEKRRISNGCGLSIILPEEWKRCVSVGPCSICVNNGGSRRIGTKIVVSEPWDDMDPAMLNDVEQTMFLRMPALRRLTIEEGTFDDPGYTRLEFFLQRGEQWWMIHLLLQGEYDVIPDELMQYLETVQLPSDDETTG